MLKRLTLVIPLLLVLGMFIFSDSAMAYTIDGSLNDWGVTPFTDWLPDISTVDYTQTNNVNLYGVRGYGEAFDFEALYFDDDPNYFYFAVVYSGLTDGDDLDIGLDLNNNATVGNLGVLSGPDGDGYGLEYGINYGAGQLWSVTDWGRAYNVQEQGSPYYIRAGINRGSATAVIAIHNYGGAEDGTRIYEAMFSRSLLLSDDLSPGDEILIHAGNWCGNDSINLQGKVDTVVPEPYSLFLLGSGLVGMVAFGRRRTSPRYHSPSA